MALWRDAASTNSGAVSPMIHHMGEDRIHCQWNDTWLAISIKKRDASATLYSELPVAAPA
jgi:hypothetical protein